MTKLPQRKIILENSSKDNFFREEEGYFSKNVAFSIFGSILKKYPLFL